MLKEFRKFLLETNALALAVGVIIGGAVGKMVGSLATDVLMPVIGLIVPGGTWREAKYVLRTNPDGSQNAVLAGQFLASIVDFVIIAGVVFLITKSLLKPAPEAPKAATRECPECRELVPAAARRCRACTSVI